MSIRSARPHWASAASSSEALGRFLWRSCRTPRRHAYNPRADKSSRGKSPKYRKPTGLPGQFPWEMAASVRIRHLRAPSYDPMETSGSWMPQRIAGVNARPHQHTTRARQEHEEATGSHAGPTRVPSGARADARRPEPRRDHRRPSDEPIVCERGCHADACLVPAWLGGGVSSLSARNATLFNPTERASSTLQRSSSGDID